MSSITERMDSVQSITINSDEEFCLKITHRGIEIGKILVGVRSLTKELLSGNCDISIWTLNPSGVNNKIVLTEYAND